MRFLLGLLIFISLGTAHAGGSGPDSICRVDKTQVNKSEAFKSLFKGQYPEECAAFWGINLSRLEQLYGRRGNYDGIEVLITMGSGNVESFFGHGQIRFVGTGQVPKEDLVLGFEAQIIPSDSKTFLGIPAYIKGVFGGYRAVPVVRTIEETWELYSFKQSRPTYRFIIPSNPAIRESILVHLKEWMTHVADNDENPLHSYVFVTKNCITLLMKLLEDSGFALSGSLGGAYSKSKIDWKLKTGIQGIVTPKDAFYMFREELLNPYLPLLIPKGKIVLNEVTTDIEQIDNHLAYAAKTVTSVGPFTAAPYILYQLCEDLECGLNVRDASRKVWNTFAIPRFGRFGEIIRDDEWRIALGERLEAYTNYLNRYEKLGLIETAKARPHYLHWKILLDTNR